MNRARAIMTLILSFLPLDAMQMMVAGQAVLFNALSADAAGDLMRGMTDARKPRTRADMIRMGLLTAKHLDTLIRLQGRAERAAVPDTAPAPAPQPLPAASPAPVPAGSPAASAAESPRPAASPQPARAVSMPLALAPAPRDAPQMTTLMTPPMAPQAALQTATQTAPQMAPQTARTAVPAAVPHDPPPAAPDTGSGAAHAQGRMGNGDSGMEQRAGPRETPPARTAMPGETAHPPMTPAGHPEDTRQAWPLASARPRPEST